MKRIDAYFLAAAAAFFTLGVSLGIIMGIKQDFTYMHVHAHINLIGWASLALYGLFYRAYPALAKTRLAAIHFAFATIGAVVFLSGLPLAMNGRTILFAVLGSFLWLAGVVSFFTLIVRDLLRPAGRGAAPATPAMA